MRTICTLPILAAFLSLACARPAPEPSQPTKTDEPPPSLAILHARVVPMRPAEQPPEVLNDHTIVIEDGEIIALGPSSKIKVPQAAEIIDAKGRYLLPGLIDTHVHLDGDDATRLEDHLELYLAHGVTTVQSMHGSPWHLELRRRVAAGELLGPRILTTGPTTAAEGTDTPEKARALAARQHAAGYDAIKMYGSGTATPMDRATYAATLDAARQLGIRVIGHAPRRLPFDAVLEEGQDSIDHMEEILYTHSPIADLLRPLLNVQFGRTGLDNVEEDLAALSDLQPQLQTAIDALARRLRDADLAVSPTLIAFETIARQTSDTEFAALQVLPELGWIDPATRLAWGPSLNSYRNGWIDRLEAVSEILDEGFKIQQRLVAAFDATGVRLLTGTDAPLEFVVPGVSLHRELELLVASGLEPWEALRAATSAPADELGIPAGWLEVGRLADLVMVDENPLQDITRIRQVAGVVTAGRWLPGAEIQDLLGAIRSRHEALSTQAEALITAWKREDTDAIVEGYLSVNRPVDGLGDFTEWLLVRLSDRLREDGESDLATIALRRATELRPDSAEAWERLAEMLLLGGQAEDALPAYRRALEIDPERGSAELGVAWLEEKPTAYAKIPSAELLDRSTGDFGQRHLRVRDGELVYWREPSSESSALPLRPFAPDVFQLDDVPYFRLRLERDAEGRVERLVGLYYDGRQDVSERDG